MEHRRVIVNHRKRMRQRIATCRLFPPWSFRIKGNAQQPDESRIPVHKHARGLPKLPGETARQSAKHTPPCGKRSAGAARAGSGHESEHAISLTSRTRGDQPGNPALKKVRWIRHLHHPAGSVAHPDPPVIPSLHQTSKSPCIRTFVTDARFREILRIAGTAGRGVSGKSCRCHGGGG